MARPHNAPAPEVPPSLLSKVAGVRSRKTQAHAAESPEAIFTTAKLHTLYLTA